MQIRYVNHWQQLETETVPKDFEPTTRVTIIIPARNEAESIAACLISIGEQNYPKSLLNVIVISDHSTDETIVAAKKAVKKAKIIPKNVIVLEADGEGKKAALKQAMNAADSEWVTTIDADVVLRKDCIRSSVWMHVNYDAKIVTGPVLIEPGNSTIEYFQALDQTGLMLITGAGYDSQKQLLGNGAFLSFSKEAFKAVNGYAGNEQFASGDDVFLIEKISQAYTGKAYFLKNPDAVAFTKAETDWSSLIDQRVRWASKNKALGQKSIQWTWGFVWLYCMSICLMMFASLFDPVLFFLPVIILLGIKILADHLMLSESTRFFGKKKWMQHFLFSEITHVFYVCFVGTRALIGKKYIWKERKVI